MSDYGPVYGVELIATLPLDGGMRQAMPSRRDLQQVREISERTAAGYEVLLEHYFRALEACRKAAASCETCNDGVVKTIDYPGDKERTVQCPCCGAARAVLAKGCVK